MAFRSSPFSFIRQVLYEPGTCKGTKLTLFAQYWRKTGSFQAFLELSEVSCSSSSQARSSQSATLTPSTSDPPHASPSLVASVLRFANLRDFLGVWLVIYLIIIGGLHACFIRLDRYIIEVGILLRVCTSSGPNPFL